MDRMPSLDDYKIILYPQEAGGWVAEVPAIAGCYALMETREEALRELERVFEMIRDEYMSAGRPLPADRTELLTNA
jgi:predicted RNase H-like HicB family nuclease